MRIRLRSGFSFAEVMFAVVILGIGFIMVASIFPLAIEQNRSTADEAMAACIARDAMSTIQTSTHADDYPSDTSQPNVTRAFADASPALWNEVSTSAINPADPRYAWVPFFAKADAMGTLRITVLVVRRWNHGVYTAADAGGDLLPRGISITSITHQGDGDDLIQITRDPSGMYQCAAPGAFVIIRSGVGDINGNPVNESGRIFRLGRLLSESSTDVSYALDVSEGLAAGESCDTATAAIIGRDYKDLSNPDAGYDGPAQDVAVYTTYLNPS
jgi:hypothetical protein